MVLGEYPKTNGLFHNVKCIADIIEPHVKKDSIYLATLIWRSISKVQHYDVNTTAVHDFQLKMAISQLKDLEYQADNYYAGKVKLDKFKAEVDSYK